MTTPRKQVVERYIEGFRRCDVFHFRGDRICRLVTYQVDRGRGDGVMPAD